MPPDPLLADCARYVQAELAKDKTILHPGFKWCLYQVERHMGYVTGGGAVTREQKMQKLVEVIRPLARRAG